MPFLALHTAFSIPIEDPILKFLLIMTIVLCTPLVLNKLKIPYLLGLIIAGAVIGPHGLNLVLRDSSIILSGTAGMLYILFSAGWEMDMADFVLGRLSDADLETMDSVFQNVISAVTLILDGKIDDAMTKYSK